MFPTSILVKAPCCCAKGIKLHHESFFFDNFAPAFTEGTSSVLSLFSEGYLRYIALWLQHSTKAFCTTKLGVLEDDQTERFQP